MAASDWLAALSGGIDGVEHRRERDEDLKLANRRVDNVELAAQVRAMLEQVKEEGRNSRTDKTEAGKTLRTNTVETGRNDRFADAEAGRDSRFYTGEEGKNDRASNALEQGAEQYWDKAGRDWSGLMMGDATRRRGQDVTARGQDLGASTAERGQDLAHEDRAATLGATGDSRAMQYALNAYGKEVQRLKAQNGNSVLRTKAPIPSFAEWVQSSDDPEIFSSVKNSFGSPAAAPPAASPESAPTSAPVRPAMPGGRMPAPAAAPGPGSVPGNGLPLTSRSAMPPARQPLQPPAAAAPKGLVVGGTVTLKNGKTVKVTKVNPDGTFEYQ